MLFDSLHASRMDWFLSFKGNEIEFNLFSSVNIAHLSNLQPNQYKQREAT